MRYFLAMLLSAAGPAVACSCAEPEGTVDEYVAAQYASHSVVGVFVVSDIQRGTLEFAGDRMSGRWLTLRPRRLFKGEYRDLHAQAAPRWFGTSCDAHYEQGDALLVFAKPDEPVWTHGCSPSGSLVARLDELEALFRLAKPVE